MDEEITYVTTRRNVRRGSDLSVTSGDQSFTSIQSDMNARSLPDLSTEVNEIPDLIAQINDLKSNLDYANKKIEELSQQNALLQTQLSERQIPISPKNANMKANYSAGLSSTTSRKAKKKDAIKKNSSSHVLLANSQIASEKTVQTQKKPREDTIFNTDNMQLKKTENGKKKSRLLILGSQQLSGLSPTLIGLRKKCTSYENFDVLSYIKPSADAYEILKPCYNQNFGEKDQIVLCVGENDANPTCLMHELSGAIKSLNKCNIIIVGVNYNKNINENVLNNNLKNLCAHLSNCEFIAFENPFVLSRSEYLTYLSRKINFIMDNRYYNNTYLKCLMEKHRQNLLCIRPIVEPKKGTIPYYFKKIEQKSSIQNDKNNTTTISTEPASCAVTEEVTKQFFRKSV